LGLCKQHDVAFVGFMGGSSKGPGKNDRVLYLDTVFRAFPNSWFAYGKFFLDAAVRYARARVGFNISIKQDLNMRFFEAMSYGSCLATNRNVVGWDLLGFVEGKHFVGFETPEEAVFNIGELLKEPERRENIALAGREFVRAGHTYMHRVNTLLQTCGFPLLKGNSYV
jgi:spore maturation protein CgeB